MRIGFIGDVHGVWKDLHQSVANLMAAGVDMLIQVGDFGCWSPEKTIGDSWETLRLETPVYWIDGNHEDFPFLKSLVDWDCLKPQEVAENLHYIPRGTVLDIGGLRFGFMGGAASIDRHLRINGRDWFPEELPSYAECMRLANVDPTVDVIVAHDCPEEAATENLVRTKTDEASNGNRRMLQALVEMHSPKYYVHGHYHRWSRRKINGTEYVCLADGSQKRHSTVILDTETGWV